MLNNKFNIFFYTGFMALIASQLSYALTQEDSVVISFDHPQSISVSTSFNSSDNSTYDIGETQWTVTSNNAVKVNFTGTSRDDDGTTYNAPRFHKQEVDASGVLITNRYDHLDTKYGLVIIGSDSIANETSRTNQTAIKTWRGGDIPDASPSQLVTDKTLSGSPGLYWGAIMPSDAGKFQMSLYSQGVGTADSTQSGVYSTTVTAVITANEKLNPQ